MTYRFDLPVDDGDDPGQAQSQEDVDGVGAVDVADGTVGRLLSQRRLLGGEGVRHGGAQGHQRDGRHRVLQADQTAEDGGQVTDDGGEHTDHRQRHDESWPAAEVLCRRDEGEQNLGDEPNRSQWRCWQV